MMVEFDVVGFISVSVGVAVVGDEDTVFGEDGANDGDSEGCEGDNDALVMKILPLI